MKLLRELSENIQYIKEEKDGKTNLYLSGPFAQAEVGNRNKRWYPLPVLEKECTRYVNESIKGNSAFGELNHPTGPNINLDRVAIHIKNLQKEGNNFIGKALVASTPMGGIVKGLIEDGARLGVSTRALGSVKLNPQTGLNEVQPDLRLLAIDVVSDPSGPDCWTNAMMEGASWIYDAGTGRWVEYVDDLRREMQNESVDELKANQVAAFKAFLDVVGRVKI